MLDKLVDVSLGSALWSGALLYVVYIVAQALFDPLRGVPGPLLARFTRLWFFFALWTGDFKTKNLELHRRYGPLVRLAPNEYSVDDVDAARTIYGHGTGFVKGPWYSAWITGNDPKRRGLFPDQDPHTHAAQRRKYANAFSMSTLVGYEPFVDNCVAILTQRLRELAAAGQAFDLANWMQCYAFDVIGEITFGRRFGILDTGVDKEGVFASIETRLAYTSFVGVFPWIHRYLDSLLPVRSGGLSYVGQFAAKQIAENEKLLQDPSFQGREGPPDQVARFFAVHRADPDKMSKLDILMIVMSNVFAGSDTTGISLSAVLYYLMKNPASYKQLRDELDRAAAEGSISDPITFKEAQALKYLNAVIKEALRLHPAVGWLMPRVVPAGGADIVGFHLPAGATVGINAWVAHHNRSVYGADADEWRPERWLEMDEQGRAGDVEKYAFAFGMGSRTCVGKNISLLEMAKLIPQMVRKFDFRLGGGLQNNEWKTLNTWFTKPLDFEATVALRA